MAGRLVAPLSTGTAVERVLWKRRSVLLGDGRVVPYDVLVSTMPLPDLLQRLDPPVAALGVAARKLRWTGTLTVHFCVRRPRERRRHWFYVPERRYAFYRYGFPSNINPVTVPRGFGVVSAEVSYVSGRRPADSQVTRRCARQLRELGVLGPERDVVRTMVADFPVAYVVFDRDHDRARMAALRFLAGAGIISTGRYGGWTYGGMEDAIRDGQAAAASIRAHGRRAPIRFLEGRA
jgi:protoporphyrinogen oxidase